MPGLSVVVEQLAPHGVTLARGEGSAAVLTRRGAWLVRTDANPVLVDSRAGLIDPSLDPQGFVWTAVGADADSIVATDATGVPHPLPAPNLDGEMRALEVSRDGSRLLIGTQTPGGSALTIVGIVRDAAGVPIGFGEPLNLMASATPLIDASWVDASTVAVLGEGDDRSRVDLYRIGGQHQALGRLDADVVGEQLVGGNSIDGIRVRSNTGEVWRLTSSGTWQSTRINVSFLATQM